MNIEIFEQITGLDVDGFKCESMTRHINGKPYSTPLKTDLSSLVERVEVDDDNGMDDNVLRCKKPGLVGWPYEFELLETGDLRVWVINEGRMTAMISGGMNPEEAKLNASIIYEFESVEVIEYEKPVAKISINQTSEKAFLVIDESVVDGSNPESKGWKKRISIGVSGYPLNNMGSPVLLKNMHLWIDNKSSIKVSFDPNEPADVNLPEVCIGADVVVTEMITDNKETYYNSSMVRLSVLGEMSIENDIDTPYHQTLGKRKFIRSEAFKFTA
jgi:hypothetical protein